MPMVCPISLIETTLKHLQDSGRKGVECVVLWLGERQGQSIFVREAYRPAQIAERDMFRIPPEGMDAIKALIRARRLMVAAQVHSHPKRAFHSFADDRWAIVRHEGALSLVLPRFATSTTAASFNVDVKLFRLSISNEWLEIPRSEVRSCLQIS
jgi:hypothetical protein